MKYRVQGFLSFKFLNSIQSLHFCLLWTLIIDSLLSSLFITFDFYKYSFMSAWLCDWNWQTKIFKLVPPESYLFPFVGKIWRKYHPPRFNLWWSGWQLPRVCLTWVGSQYLYFEVLLILKINDFKRYSHPLNYWPPIRGSEISLKEKKIFKGV